MKGEVGVNLEGSPEPLHHLGSHQKQPCPSRMVEIIVRLVTLSGHLASISDPMKPAANRKA